MTRRSFTLYGVLSVLASAFPMDARVKRKRRKKGQTPAPPPVSHIPKALKGSPKLRLWENEVADNAGWQRMENAEVFDAHMKSGLLVPVAPTGAGYHLAGIPPERQYLRPHATAFLAYVAVSRSNGCVVVGKGGKTHSCKGPLKITSLVETVQSKRQQGSVTKAPADGSMRSLHLTGATFDISKKPMPYSELQWMRKFLMECRERGYAVTTEERDGNCFHVFVLPRELPVYP